MATTLTPEKGALARKRAVSEGGVSPAAEPSLFALCGFVPSNVRKIFAISAAMLIPVFWHRNIVQCDLGSHVYNAWLATLISKGQAPGLYLTRRWDNVLCDNLLTWLGPHLGWGIAERSVVAISVLIFFWGAFLLVSAMPRRPVWFLLPAVATVAYGWTLQIGFSNYYLALGLGFWAVALLWRGGKRERLLGLLLLPLVLFAHLLGLVVAVGCVSYLKIREILPGYWKILPLTAAAAFIVALRHFLASHYQVEWASALPLYLMNGLNGVDQIVLGPQYRGLARILFL